MTDDAWTHAHDEPPARDLVVVPSAEEEPPEGEPQDTRPIVIVHTGDLARDTRALWQGLDESNRPATLFTYGGLMARLRPDPVTHLPSVQPLDKDMVRNEVANRVRCCKLGSDGLLVQVYPSMDLVAQLLASRTMDLPTLERLVPVPVFTEDGRLVQQPGYDEPSGVYYEPEPHLTLRPVPEKPTSRHLAVAKRWIDEIMIDFPFDSEADKAAAVTLLVEPFVRSMIVGPCPLHLFEAPTPRTGKGLLAETLALPFIGPHLTITGWPTDEGEMRKRITSLLLAGATIVLFDNVDRPIASGNLSAALTGEVWSDRVLKVSQMMKAPQRLVWIATANNPVCSSEMAGRIVSCRLDAKMERPGERPTQAFHHPRLKKWARAHRRSLIWSALVLAQHWIAQGRPEPKQVPAMGGFEGWCEVLGGILEAADIGGLLKNRDRLYERGDETLDNWRALVIAWWRRYGSDDVSTAQLLALIEELGLDWDWGEAKDDQGKRVGLGRALGGERFEMVLEDLQIRRSDKKRHGSWWWHLTPVGPHTPPREVGGD